MLVQTGGDLIIAMYYDSNVVTTPIKTRCVSMLQYLQIMSPSSCQGEPEHNWNRVITKFYEVLDNYYE